MARRGDPNRTTKPRTTASLTEAMIQEVVELVQLGVPPVVAMMAQGVNEEQFAAWVVRGTRRSKPGTRDTLQRRLVKAIAQAEARCEAILVGKVRASATTNWQAAAWLAERRFPERYVRKSVVVDKDDEPIKPGGDPFAEVDSVANVHRLPRRA